MSIPLSTIKTQLGISGDDQDARLRLLLPQALAIAESFCNRRFCKNTYTEFYDGNGSSEIVLKNIPVISITNIWEDVDREFTSDHLLTANTDYIFNAASGVVTRINAYWPHLLRKGRVPLRGQGGYMSLGAKQLVMTEDRYRKCIKVEYEAGWETIPMDIQFAVGSLVACMLREAAMGAPLTSENLDYYSYQLASSADAMQALTGLQNILKNYVVPVI